MKKIFSLVCLLAAFFPSSLSAQTVEEPPYRRSSLCSFLINHDDQPFAKEIRQAFCNIPVSDKFNDHELSVKVLTLSKKLKGAGSSKENEEISSFLDKNLVASRLVGKWFERSNETGVCHMNLIQERGLYDASEYARVLASKSTRSQALLADAGEELIGKTFVLVNDIRYVDKAKAGEILGMGLRILGALAGAATGNSNYNNLGDNTASLAETLKGFKVKINTFLYRLDWNDDVAATFYKDLYSSEPDEAKRQAFEKARGNFKLTYVGKVESSGSTTSFMGIKLDEPVQMVRKACQRAIDENIAALQSDFEEFRTKTPLVSGSPIRAFIGMKEGVKKDSRFEVLETVVSEDGKHTYKRVGVIAPMPDYIWDNRYMADEEGTPAAALGFTTFKKISGNDFVPGMLIREIKK
ncbi:MAG: hypothetical protein ACI3YC_02640 [Alloprevotella sp.]